MTLIQPWPKSRASTSVRKKNNLKEVNPFSSRYDMGIMNSQLGILNSWPTTLQQMALNPVLRVSDSIHFTWHGVLSLLLDSRWRQVFLRTHLLYSELMLSARFLQKPLVLYGMRCDPTYGLRFCLKWNGPLQRSPALRRGSTQSPTTWQRSKYISNRCLYTVSNPYGCGGNDLDFTISTADDSIISGIVVFYINVNYATVDGVRLH